MKYDKDPTTNERILEVLNKLPGELRAKLSLREYDRATRQVFIWTTEKLSEKTMALIRLQLKTVVFPRIEVNQIVRKDGFLPKDLS